MEITDSMKINEYLPLRDVVFQTLRKAILRGELEPGTRLMETQLGEKLGVSRTPIREAIRKLELEGLVVMVPRKGAQVAQFTEKDILDVLEVRAALEALAAKLACKKMDDRAFLKLQLAITEYEYAVRENDIETMVQKDVEFHETIFNATDNDKLIQLFNNVREQVNRYRITYLKNAEDNKAVHKEHLEILDALKARNEIKAAQIASKHIQTQCNAIMNFIRSRALEPSSSDKELE
ncbi:GntR family transcriptional regulator [Sporanaerobium hydrogeniformans]|uniref:GntR family transcriptional regulator n=1 Tax=Sporanaerobium hydrogeniformans TaxID=3072179 RepID=A0AC61D844_9FIRM|nr:GntR family transcriptional regulator [Sporanaerobium hydrogeniformans]PHV69372.1 GntR family transcriptional regulator [Sporanaerobium hydrogeniformans]